MPTFQVGDHVVVAEVANSRDAEYVGVEGELRGRVVQDNSYLVSVPRLEGQSRFLVRARKITTPAQLPSAPPAGTRASDPLRAADLRAAAVRTAREVLGEDFILDDLLGAAEFILGEHKPVPRVEAPPTDASAAPTLSVEEARKVTEGGLLLPIEMPGELKVFTDGIDDNDVVVIKSPDSVYLTGPEVDSLIAFLQAAKVVHASR